VHNLRRPIGCSLRGVLRRPVACGLSRHVVAKTTQHAARHHASPHGAARHRIRCDRTFGVGELPIVTELPLFCGVWRDSQAGRVFSHRLTWRPVLPIYRQRRRDMRQFAVHVRVPVILQTAYIHSRIQHKPPERHPPVSIIFSVLQLQLQRCRFTCAQKLTYS